MRFYTLSSLETDVKIMFQSRPQPVSVPRSIVMIADLIAGDNAEMAMPPPAIAHPPPPPPAYAPHPAWNISYPQNEQEPRESREMREGLGAERREPWRVKGVLVRLNDGRSGVLVRCGDGGSNDVMLDDHREVQVPTENLSPVMAFASDQQVLVIDDPDNVQRAVMVKMDGDDLVVRIDGFDKMVKTAVETAEVITVGK